VVVNRKEFKSNKAVYDKEKVPQKLPTMVP
jgi:hypothetical protein